MRRVVAVTGLLRRLFVRLAVALAGGTLCGFVGLNMGIAGGGTAINAAPVFFAVGFLFGFVCAELVRDKLRLRRLTRD